MPETRIPIITLTTDFGTADHYVSSIKGAILCVINQVHLVDISHDVPPRDISAAAYTLRGVASVFPPRTVHLVVVDPGVGTARRPIVVASENHLYVGPDNGVFSFVYEADSGAKVHQITAAHYFRDNPSPTFHGRDIFAPVAAQLARGIGIEMFGEPVEDPVKLELPRPKVTQEGRVRATIIQVDRFGNLVTNITQSALEALMQKMAKSGIRGAGSLAQAAEMKATYAEGPSGAPFLLFNSSRLLEVAVNGGRASDLLKLKAGDAVELDLA